MTRGLVFFAATAVAAALSAVGSAAPAKPSVTVASIEPVTVVGRAFQAAERVRVVVYVRRQRAATAVANRRGRFVVHYPFAVGDCTIVRVRAWGNRGTTASYALIPTCA